MNKIKFKEQIKYGTHYDPFLFKQLKIVDGITDDTTIQILMKRIQIIELKQNQTIKQNSRLYYKLLFGDINIIENEIIALQDSEIIVINQNLIDFFLEDEKCKIQEEYINILKNIYIFSQLDYYELKRIIQQSQIMILNENRVICQEGNIPKECYILLNGQIICYKEIEDIQIIIDKYKQYIGIYECLNYKQMQHNVKTIKRSTLIKINRELLLIYENNLKIKKDKIIDINIYQPRLQKIKCWNKQKQNILNEVQSENANKKRLRKIRIYSQC